MESCESESQAAKWDGQWRELKTGRELADRKKKMAYGFTAGTSEGGGVVVVDGVENPRRTKEEQRTRTSRVADRRNNDQWTDTLTCAPSFPGSPEQTGLDEDRKGDGREEWQSLRSRPAQIMYDPLFCRRERPLQGPREAAQGILRPMVRRVGTYRSSSRPTSPKG